MAGLLAEHEATYGTSSSAAPPPMTTRERNERTQKKRGDAQRALDEARQGQPSASQYENRRRSVSVETTSEEDPPPSYNDAMRQDARRT
ncbi:hypothetical protein DDE82_004795 [Stemphylium lycopersici]|uniref:Uncharacterized protein n=1 Tax=Stemphylium lycopersici TaxID=183478 RepID=A0A364N929_STELY|nr:hypothetical protein TW65_05080 [Stemphylium lycopersici]RAR03917.1 hypothetical protein DDE82_004795 [Stemphylium lycopersici]RAR13848.1 hypothetical protein DDE83_002736 [Stemphylium lycopersici]